jgi:integrase
MINQGVKKMRHHSAGLHLGVSRRVSTCVIIGTAMSVFRRSYKDKNGAVQTCEVYNYDFIFHGQRYRGSTDCTTKTRARAFEDDLKKRLERGLAGLPIEEPAMRVRTITVALDEYEKHYAVDHAPKSLALVEERGAHLRRLLGNEIAAGLTEPRIQEYRKQRLSEKASPRTVDMEVAVLSRAFGAKWSILWPKLKPLDKGSEVGKVITPPDEAKILEAAAKSDSRFIYAYLMIAFRTGMRAGEVRKLQWDRFVIGEAEHTSIVRVGKSKTKAGEHRAIPMDRRLWATMVHYRAWYQDNVGEPLPEHFVFPFGHGKTIDPTRALTTIKKAWQNLKTELKLNYRLHDARHTVATSMAVADVPEAKRRYLMGHTNENVIRRYTHLQAEDCRADLERVFAIRESSKRVPTVSPTVFKRKRKAVAGSVQ